MRAPRLLQLAVPTALRLPFAVLLPIACCLSQVPLRELPALARSRAERLRPQQEQALLPFWPDLALEYQPNQAHLDRRIEEVAALGDSVVPLLLEKLQPPAGDGTARNLAANCRRVLEKLDPGSFLDALAELIASRNETARREAIALVGHAQGPRATRILLDVLDQNIADERLVVLAGLARQRAAAAAPHVVPMLGSSDRRVREAVLDYLIQAAPASAVDQALEAMAAESENRLLPLYVDYLARAAHENAAAARALLPFLDGSRLDFTDKKHLVRALATVAPKGHDQTVRKLQDILQSGETSSFEIETSLTLRALGDETGVKKMREALKDQLRRKKDEPLLYEQRANLLFAIGEFRDAGDDYEKVAQYSKSTTLTRRALTQLVRCEARRPRLGEMLKYLKALEPTYEDVQDLAAQDPFVQEQLQQERARSWLQTLPHKNAAKDQPR